MLVQQIRIAGSEEHCNFEKIRGASENDHGGTDNKNNNNQLTRNAEKK